MIDLTQLRRLLVTASMVGLLSACSVTFDAGTLGVNASLSDPAGQTAEGTQFEVSRRAVFLFFGILRIAHPSLENVLAGQLVDGSEIRDLSVKVRSRFGDIVVAVLTGGLIVPRSVTYKGVVVGGAGN